MMNRPPRLEKTSIDENLNKWFKEKWVRFGPDGKIRGDCARGDDSEGKPKCLPQSKAHNLGKQGRKYAASKKRREDPNPERTGKAKNVATKKKTNEEQLDELNCWSGYTRVKGVPAGAPGSCKKKTNESINEDVGGNYLYHATSAEGLKSILQSGQVKAADGPQNATQAQTKLPTVSMTRDWGYASGSNARPQSAIGTRIVRDAVLIFDRSRIENNYKTLGTSQSSEFRGLALNPHQDRPRGGAVQNTDPRARKNAKAKYDLASSMGGEWAASYNTPKHGGEFEEAVVVPKGGLPIKGTLVGFWVNPASSLMKDPEIMNNPLRLEKTGPNKFIRAGEKVMNEDIPFNKCPSCHGPIVHESMMNEKQDACYHKVKSRYKVWPSAYASGALVQCRKKGASNWGTGGKKKNESSIMKGIVGEDLSQADVDGIARFADKLYKKLGIDITFTKHFMDRVNDDRNGKPISGAELVRLFKREYERWGKDVAQMGPDMEGTFKDLTTDINLPFVLRWDRDEKELDLVAKTVMRKKDFKTRNQEFPVDESIAQFGDPIEPGYYVVDKFSDRLVYPERFKTHFDAEGYLLRKIPSRNWNRYEVAYISDETGLVNAENWYGLVKAGMVDPNKITGFVNKQYNESSSPKYMKEATDGRLEPDLALLQAKRITKAIKYDNSVNEIITQIQELAERTNGIDMGILEDSISMVSKIAQRLESAVYGLENAFAEAAGNVGLDEAVSGRIYMVRSRDGVEKAFNDRNSVAAKNWENTIAKKPKQPSYSAPKIRKPSSDEIWQKVTTAVANYFPDGDPSDYLYLWVERNNLNWDDVTRAIKKNGYKDLWDYWNALAHDYNSDADHDERISGGKENRPRAPFMESKTKESSIMRGIKGENR